MANATQSYYVRPELPTRWQNFRYDINPLNRHGSVFKGALTCAFWAFVFKSSEQLVRDMRTYSWSFISEAFSRSTRGAATDGLRHMTAKYIAPSSRYALGWAFVGACIAGVCVALSSLFPDRKAQKKLTELNEKIKSLERMLRELVEQKPEPSKASDIEEPLVSWTAYHSKVTLRKNESQSPTNLSVGQRMFSHIKGELHPLYTRRFELCRQQAPSWNEYLTSDPTPIFTPPSNMLDERA